MNTIRLLILVALLSVVPVLGTASRGQVVHDDKIKGFGEVNPITRYVDRDDSFSCISLEMHYFFLYKLTSPTGRVYIGQSRCLDKRFSAYRSGSIRGQTLLAQSLAKHGWDAHTKEIVESGFMYPEEINRLEIAYIKMYRDRGVSLNLAPGGEAGGALRGAAHPGSRPVIQLSAEGVFMREWTSAHEAGAHYGWDASNIRAGIADGNVAYAKGYLWVLKSAYNPEAKVSYNDPKRAPVIQFTLDGVYVALHASMTDAARQLGLKACNLSAAAHGKGRTKSSGGFLWITKADYDAGKRPVPVDKPFLPRAVACYDKITGAFVGEYSSIAEASRQIGISEDTITRRCLGLSKRGGKYRFEFAEPS